LEGRKLLLRRIPASVGSLVHRWFDVVSFSNFEEMTRERKIEKLLDFGRPDLREFCGSEGSKKSSSSNRTENPQKHKKKKQILNPKPVGTEAVTVLTKIVTYANRKK
jgi:hypothetical protein